MQGYSPPEEGPSEYQTIPMDKVEDFGVHSKRYYPLEVSYFRSALDSALLGLLWNKHWVATLSASPLLATAGLLVGQLRDIGGWGVVRVGWVVLGGVYLGGARATQRCIAVDPHPCPRTPERWEEAGWAACGRR